MKLLKLASLLVVVAVLSSCVVAPLRKTEAAAELQKREDVETITPFVLPPSEGPYACGTQALAAVIHHHKPELAPETLYDAWHEAAFEGTTVVDLLLESRRQGFKAEVFRGTHADLLDAVKSGTPLIVMFDAAPRIYHPFGQKTESVRLYMMELVGMEEREINHWGVVTGIAGGGDTVLVAAEGDRHFPIARRQFMRRWWATDYCALRVIPN